MATYVIGDVHGRLDSVELLLRAVAFDPGVDQAWFVGDLVNRGPRSIETVEFVRALGSSAVTVLGNHDLFLLAVAEGILNEEPSDRLRECLAHPAAGRALEWLRRQKLIRIDRRRRTILVHAGLPHVWTLGAIRSRAARVEALLSGPPRDCRRALGLLGRRGLVSPAHDSDNPAAPDDLTYCLNALVHLRRIAPMEPSRSTKQRTTRSMPGKPHRSSRGSTRGPPGNRGGLRRSASAIGPAWAESTVPPSTESTQTVRRAAAWSRSTSRVAGSPPSDASVEL